MNYSVQVYKLNPCYIKYMCWLPCQFAGTYISFHLRPKCSQNSSAHRRLPVTCTQRLSLLVCRVPGVRLDVCWWDLDLWFPTRTGQIVARAVLSSPWGTALPNARPEIHSNLDFVAFFHHPPTPRISGRTSRRTMIKIKSYLSKSLYTFVGWDSLVRCRVRYLSCTHEL